MRAKKGFTLVELLVVVAIIALLLAMILPTINLFKELRIRFHCKTNLSKIHKVIQCYAAKYNGLLPCGSTASWWESEAGFPGGTPKGRFVMTEALIGCGAKAEVFTCPAHPQYEGLRDDREFYDANVTKYGVRGAEVHQQGYRLWKMYEYNYGGSNSWQKYYGIAGYGIFSYNPVFGRHPSSGEVMPSRWDTWRVFGKNSPAQGRMLPQRIDEQGNVPLAADEMRWNTGGSYFQGFWHFDGRVTRSGQEAERELTEFGDGGGHTLLVSGAIEWYDWGSFHEAGPQYKDQGYDYYFGGLPED